MFKRILDWYRFEDAPNPTHRDIRRFVVVAFLFGCSLSYVPGIPDLPSVMAQTSPPGGGGGSGSGGITSITEGVTTTTGFAAGEVIRSDGSVVQGIQLSDILAGNRCTSAAGTDAYECSSPAPFVCPAALSDTMVVAMTTDVANTGAATFAYCGLSAKAIVKDAPTASVALATGDMLANRGYLLKYAATGDNWQLLSIPASVVLNNQANTFAGVQTISGNLVLNTDVDMTFITGLSYNNGRIHGWQTPTPDGLFIHPGVTSNSIRMSEATDNFDFANGACGTAACTDPADIIFSADSDTTQYNHRAAWGHAGGAVKTLTEATATSLVRIPVAAGIGAGGEICYTTEAYDATDQQVRSACIRFTVSNKAGTETCSLVGVAGTTDTSISETEDGSGSGAISTGTLMTAVTCDVTPTNAVDIQMAATSSLTQTTLRTVWNVNLVGRGQPARQ
jgi:hypothetical protein